MHSTPRFHPATFRAGRSSANFALAFVITQLFLASAIVFFTLTPQSAEAQTYHIIHNFTGGSAGAYPTSTLVMDAGGNLYGTTQYGGSQVGGCAGYGGCGTVFRMRPGTSGWHYDTLYKFSAVDGGFGSGGEDTATQLVIGPDGAPYGTTVYGGPVTSPWRVGYGTVFDLGSAGGISSLWKENVLYSFMGGADGSWPIDVRLTFDQQGNIYGTAGCTVFKLTPSNGQWIDTPLYTIFECDRASGVIFDTSGNLYGRYVGAIFQLVPSGDGWIERDIYGSNGWIPMTGLIFDSLGNLYGTASPMTGGGGLVSCCPRRETTGPSACCTISTTTKLPGPAWRSTRPVACMARFVMGLAAASSS